MTKVTFVLPHGGSAGGVRVTVEMANRLLDRGHDVRIAYRVAPFLSKERLSELARTALRYVQGSNHFDWLREFRGPRTAFSVLDEMDFADGEVVIAVGEYAVKYLHPLQANVVKMRYCHCLFDHFSELNKFAWGISMPTLAVSEGLVPELERYAGAPVLAVVPNGINTSEYFVQEERRDGIGLIFRNSSHKGPEVARALVDTCRSRFSEVPWHAFGTSRRPSELHPHEYTQYPSIARARETYNRCKVWIVTSRDEGFCLPILEAMACGCAVITSNHSVAADLIEHGVNGFIVDYGDVNAYLEKIQLLLTNELLRQQFVSRGFETVKKFTWDGAVTKMEEVLQQVRAEHPRREELAHVVD